MFPVVLPGPGPGRTTVPASPPVSLLAGQRRRGAGARRRAGRRPRDAPRGAAGPGRRGADLRVGRRPGGRDAPRRSTRRPSQGRPGSRGGPTVPAGWPSSPDVPGSWRVRVIEATGHGLDLEVEVAPPGSPEARSGRGQRGAGLAGRSPAPPSSSARSSASPPSAWSSRRSGPGLAQEGRRPAPLTMHLPDGFLSPQLSLPAYAVARAALGLGGAPPLRAGGGGVAPGARLAHRAGLRRSRPS